MADEFFRRGITKVYEVPAIADPAAPTAIELGAGDDISDDIADIAGFSFQNSPIATPKLSTTFTTSIPGEDTTEDPTLTFYEKRTGNPLQATMAKGTATHIVIFYRGLAGAIPAAADDCEVWPVQSTGPSREYSMGNDPARWMAKFTATDPPEFDATVA